jgi:hypothetical protein
MNEYNLDAVQKTEAEPSLTDTLCMERHRLEAQLNQMDSASTETLRLALRRYRSLSRQLSPY